MSTFVIGDIHNNAKSLQQCLDQSNFDLKFDTLISLGDICDGPGNTQEVIEILLTINNFILCRGNHDSSTVGRGYKDFGWALRWMITGEELPLWWNQGGIYTAKSYNFDHTTVPQSHIRLLQDAKVYHIDEYNNLYVHGGFKPRTSITLQDPEYIMWDRKLAYKYGRGYAKQRISGYNHIFLGHTNTRAVMQNYNYTTPLTHLNVTCLDTGCGTEGGVLTIMDIKTLNYWQSDKQ